MTPEEVLREAFEAGTRQVPVAPDALRLIRDRVAGRARRRRLRVVAFVSTGTAIAATAAAVVFALAGRAPAPPSPDVANSTSSSPSPSPSAGPSPSAAGGHDLTVPVYYVGTVAGRPVLYREYRTVQGNDDVTDAIRAGVASMLADPPLDPDYTSAWPAGASVRGVTVVDGVSTVDLSGVQGTVDPALAQIAVQQLVWTVTAVAADRHATLTGVRLRFDGAARASLWGAVDVSGVLVRAAASSTQAPVWIISPQQGATVPGTFTVQLDGSVFEATVRLRVRDQTGGLVSDQQVLLSGGAPARGQAAVTLTLPPGHYAIEAYYLSAKDGSEQGLDGHAITVR